MAKLWRVKHEKFAQAYANGMSKAQAYYAAGYQSKTREGAKQKAKELLRRPEVRARIDELQKRDLKPLTDARTLAREWTSEMIRVLVTIALDEKAPRNARISAANSILERGNGKAAVVIAGDSENPISVIKRVIVEATGEEATLIEGHAEPDVPQLEVSHDRANGAG